jgi:uncharacterized protein YaaR (DUF327 family)
MNSDLARIATSLTNRFVHNLMLQYTPNTSDDISQPMDNVGSSSLFLFLFRIVNQKLDQLPDNILEEQCRAAAFG